MDVLAYIDAHPVFWVYAGCFVVLLLVVMYSEWSIGRDDP